MRLIDADKLIAFIDKGKYCNPNVLTFSENDLCEMITEQPTAYDVEKVVEELVKNSEQIDEFDEYTNKKLVLITRRIVDIRKAIDIVRGGTSDEF